MKNAHTTFYLVRHGETEWNAEPRRKQGHMDSPLTERGMAQAETTAEKLKDVMFDAIWSSDLGRAVQTAEILRQDRNIEINRTPLLRERSLGEYEGMLQADYNELMKDAKAAYNQLSPEEQWHYQMFEGYESDAMVSERIAAYLLHLSQQHSGQRVLVVTHGGVIRTFLARIGFAPMEKLRGGSIANGAVVELLSDGEAFELRGVEGYRDNSVNNE